MWETEVPNLDVLPKWGLSKQASQADTASSRSQSLQNPLTTSWHEHGQETIL